MLDQLIEWLDNFTGHPMMGDMDNESLIVLITSPMGLAVCGALFVLLVLRSHRVSAVILSTVVAGIYMVRHTVTDTSGPNSSIYLFMAGAILLAGVGIFYTLIKHD